MARVRRAAQTVAHADARRLIGRALAAALGLALLLQADAMAAAAHVRAVPAGGTAAAPAAAPVSSAAAPVALEPSAAPPLAFAVDLPTELNRFLRTGNVAAQLVVETGRSPRLLVAFPAGDSGLGLWFDALAQPVRWKIIGAVRPITALDTRGRTLRGISAQLTAEVPRLVVHQALLSSIRVLRDYESSGHAPAPVQVAARSRGTALSWSRDRLDGAAGFRLSLAAADGSRLSGRTFLAATDGRIHLQLRALCGAPPLIPLGGASLFAPSTAARQAHRDRRLRDQLAFLSYREKYLAGAWRYDTYFGRDTLIALRLLQPILQPRAVASGLDAVLERLSSDGEVAHEETIGEYAILLNEAAGRGASAAPVYDYGMIDEDFLLAPLAAHFLLDEPAGRALAAQWLAGEDRAGVRRGNALMRNLRYVILRTAAFARSPRAANLVGLKPGHDAGDWRDSPQGLDGGTYPYDVNVALVPAALRAIARLSASGLLTPYQSAADRRLLGRARFQRNVWTRAAPPLFRVHIDAARAAADVRRYARSVGVDPAEPLAALHRQAVDFPALALDASGRALPVMHSDEVFTLLYGRPGAAQISAALDTLMRPFPAGLMTPVGLVVANPAYAGPAAQRRFGREDYHGTVIWGWPEAALAAGLTRQLDRKDLPPTLRTRLARARQQLWRVISAASAYRGVELWSWANLGGRFHVEPFRPRGGEAEANAAQLWSTVSLALAPPGH